VRVVGSFDRDQVAQMTPDQPDAGSCIMTIVVLCRSLEVIVAESNLPHVDIVVVAFL
jgi:hypothetical protein